MYLQSLSPAFSEREKELDVFVRQEQSCRKIENVSITMFSFVSYGTAVVPVLVTGICISVFDFVLMEFRISY